MPLIPNAYVCRFTCSSNAVDIIFTVYACFHKITFSRFEMINENDQISLQSEITSNENVRDISFVEYQIYARIRYSS